MALQPTHEKRRGRRRKKTGQFQTDGWRAMNTNPPIDEARLSLVEVREAVPKLKGGKVAGACNIIADLLRDEGAGGKAMTRGFYVVLNAM